MTRRLSPEFYARELSHNLEIKNVPVDPWEICEELDIKVCYEPFKQCEALLCIKNGRKKIILNENIPYYLRHKFSLAHEIGHYWCVFCKRKFPIFAKIFPQAPVGNFFVNLTVSSVIASCDSFVHQRLTNNNDVSIDLLLPLSFAHHKKHSSID